MYQRHANESQQEPGYQSWIMSPRGTERDMRLTTFTCQTLLFFSIPIKKKKKKVQNLVTVKQESGTIKCDT